VDELCISKSLSLKFEWSYSCFIFLVKKLCFEVLTPKGLSPFFGPFLKFGQAIVDAIFVQKISNFW
jgi:hypothetical protein